MIRKFEKACLIVISRLQAVFLNRIDVLNNVLVPPRMIDSICLRRCSRFITDNREWHVAVLDCEL